MKQRRALREEERAAIESSAVKWRICIYIRLSKEDSRNFGPGEKSDGKGRKSESVRNQKSILLSWIEEYFAPGTYEITGCFEDDGLTGTDDTRESFKRMLEAIEQGKGNCVVVKTLSRAFRNYSDQGYYLEEYFPSRNVRFISTMDSFVDTYADAEAVYGLDVPMYGLLNDRFAATTSRSVRRTLDDKRRKGKFIGAFPPWGFLKDPEDRNHLILDPQTAPIKVQMKDWILREGMSLAGVAKRLNSLGIPNPTRYKQMKGWKYKNPHALDNDGLWCASTVKNNLLNPMNLGHMVQGRQKVVSYKIHDKIPVPEEDWFIVRNTHEAVFSQEDYDQLRELLERDTRTANGQSTVHLFAGMIKCAECQKAMHRSHSRGHVYYKCRTRLEKSKEACNVRSIREDRLQEAVLEAVRMQISFTDPLKAAEKVAENENEDESLRELDELLEDRKREFENLQDLYDGLYDDWRSGELSEPEYRRMRERYADKMARQEELLANLGAERSVSVKNTSRNSAVFETFLQQKNIGRLDRPLLISFIDTIYVHPDNRITIKFRFKDELLRLTRTEERENETETSQ